MIWLCYLPRLMLRSTLCFAFWLSLALSSPAAEVAFDLSDTPINTLPAGFTSVLEGKGTPGDWRVIEAELAPVIPSLTGQSATKHTSRAIGQLSREGISGRYPMLVYQGDIYADFTFRSSFKVVDGAVEQMAGLAFRIQDATNYYYVRASVAEGTLYFFKVVNGLRSSPIGVKASFTKGAWYDLAVKCTGNQIQILLDNKEAIPMLSDRTFNLGKVGLWTAADSVAYFANVKIDYVPREILAQTLVRSAMAKYTQVDDLLVFSKAPKDSAIKVIASAKPGDLGRPGTKLEADVIARSKIYHSNIQKTVTVTMPMHDCNGETVAAVRLVMRTFPGETEKTALTRAVPVIRLMESHIRTHADLVN